MALLLGCEPLQMVCMEEVGTAVPGVDPVVQKSEPSFQAEQVSSELDLLRHGSTGVTRSSLLAPGCPAKVAMF